MLIKEGVLQQSALEENDSYASPGKQYALLELVLDIHERGTALLDVGAPVQELLAMPILAEARRCKSVYTSDQVDQLRAFGTKVKREFDRLRAEYIETAEAS